MLVKRLQGKRTAKARSKFGKPKVSFLDLGFGKEAERLQELAKKNRRKRWLKGIELKKAEELTQSARKLLEHPQVKLKLGSSALQRLKRMKTESVKVINGDFLTQTHMSFLMAGEFADEFKTFRISAIKR